MQRSHDRSDDYSSSEIREQERFLKVVVSWSARLHVYKSVLVVRDFLFRANSQC